MISWQRFNYLKENKVIVNNDGFNKGNCELYKDFSVLAISTQAVLYVNTEYYVYFSLVGTTSIGFNLFLGGAMAMVT